MSGPLRNALYTLVSTPMYLSETLPSLHTYICGLSTVPKHYVGFGYGGGFYYNIFLLNLELNNFSSSTPHSSDVVNNVECMFGWQKKGKINRDLVFNFSCTPTGLCRFEAFRTEGYMESSTVGRIGQTNDLFILPGG